jgi:hypothetical protein
MAPRPPAPLPLMADPIKLIDQHPVPAVLITVVALAALIPVGFLARRLLRAAARLRARTSSEHLLTLIAAGIATAVSAQGMWRFFGDVLHFTGPLRVLTFAFIETAVITSAVRARQAMRENYNAGVDGIAVWALTSLSAVLSSLDARSFGEVVLRLAAPLVAAWLWERGMALERRRLTGRTRINWRLTPERVLTQLGLADPTDRNASEVDAQRRLMRLALAAKHARNAQTTGKDRKQERALAKLDRAMERAVEYAGLGTDPDRQATLLAQLGVLYNSASLLDLTPDAPWAPKVSGGQATQVTDDSTDPTPDPEGDRTPVLSPGPDIGLPAPQLSDAPAGHRPDMTPAAPEPEPVYAIAAAPPDQTQQPSDDTSADMSDSSELHTPTDDITDPGELSALFMDALTRHDGSVAKARTDMEQAGHRPPSRGYAYTLRKTWVTQQAAASAHLTRVK